jgi:hypothetical protein
MSTTTAPAPAPGSERLEYADLVAEAVRALKHVDQDRERSRGAGEPCRLR